MKLAILTTDTLHHLRFCQEVARRAEVAAIFLEPPGSPPPFPTRHAFEDRRDEHELRVWFDGAPPRFEDLAPRVERRSPNDAASVDALRSLALDVAIVFGTRKLGPAVIATCPRGIVNLHGGNPEDYRGLDTHLWAIYHRDLSALVTTLHRASPELDGGETILQAPVPLRRGMEIHELRSANTGVCVELTLAALDMWERRKDFISRPQRRAGRTYSAMPEVLKGVCAGRFARLISERFP